MSRVPHHLAVLFHEYSSWASSRRTRICTPARCEPGGGWLFHRGKESGYVLCCLLRRLLLNHLLPGYLFCSEIMPPHHDLKLMLVNTLRKVYTIVVQQGVPSQASLGPRGGFSYAHSPRAELPHSVPERGCDPGRTDTSSWVIIPQIVRHPFLARCQWLQSRLQDRIYANGPCMLFAL
jgi:hypothetical protein